MPERTVTPALRAPSAPLRILLVVDSLDGGGAEAHVVGLALALAARGHDVAVAASANGVLTEPLVRGGIPFTPLVGRLVKRRLSPRFAAGLRSLVRSGRFDLVHAHIFASEAAAAVATLGSDVPLVVTEHTEAPWRGRRERLASRFLYARCARIVAVSTAIAYLLEDAYGVPQSRIVLVPPGLRPASPARVSPTDVFPTTWNGGSVVGRVCRLEPEKGVDVFLRAAARVAAAVPETHFAVIGDGSARPRLEALARELGLGDRVRFCGFREDARALIPLLDVLAVSSLSDGTPLVVLEAMDAGVPVVASAVGGIVDEIRNGLDGLLVPPGDERALAEAVLDLVVDEARAARLAAAGRLRVAAFSHDRMVDRLLDVYARALVAPADRAARTAR